MENSEKLDGMTIKELNELVMQLKKEWIKLSNEGKTYEAQAAWEIYSDLKEYVQDKASNDEVLKLHILERVLKGGNDE